jgi:hypothetical protein
MRLCCCTFYNLTQSCAQRNLQSVSFAHLLLLLLLLLFPAPLQPLNPVMALERTPTATAEEKAAAYEQLLQPEGPFKQRLGLLDTWLVSTQCNTAVKCRACPGMLQPVV